MWNLVASSGVIAVCSELNNPRSHPPYMVAAEKHKKKPSLETVCGWSVSGSVATIQ